MATSSSSSSRSSTASSSWVGHWSQMIEGSYAAGSTNSSTVGDMSNVSGRGVGNDDGEGEEHPLDELLEDLETSMSQQGSDLQSMEAKLADIETSLKRHSDRRDRMKQQQPMHHQRPSPSTPSSVTMTNRSMKVSSPTSTLSASTAAESSTVSSFPFSRSFATTAFPSVMGDETKVKQDPSRLSALGGVSPLAKYEKEYKQNRVQVTNITAAAAAAVPPASNRTNKKNLVRSTSPVPDAIIEIPSTSKQNRNKTGSSNIGDMTIMKKAASMMAAMTYGGRKGRPSRDGSNSSNSVAQKADSRWVSLTSESEEIDNDDDSVHSSMVDYDATDNDAPQPSISNSSKGSKRMIRHVTFGADDFTAPPPPAITYGKRDRSNLTFEESESGGSVDDDDRDNVSDLGNTHITSKTWAIRSRPAKISLICVGITLIFLIALVLGQSLTRQDSSSSAAAGSATGIDSGNDSVGNLSSSSGDIGTGTGIENSSDNGGDVSSSLDDIGTATGIDNGSDNSGGVSSSLDDIGTATGIDNGGDDVTGDNSASQAGTSADNSDGSNTSNNDVFSGPDYRADTNFLVGVYYYPWHGDNFHNGDGYMRKELQPPHEPVLGEYNDSDPKVIAKHMEWFRQANIGLLVTSWWGPGRLEDTNTKDVIMGHEDIGNLKIALHYETTGRLIGEGRDINTANTDIQYMCENYFNHPSYYKINGRPVIFIYVARVLAALGTLETVLLQMRSAAAKCGQNIYLIGDQVFASAPEASPDAPFIPFFYFDAVTNYDIYGSSGAPEGHAGTDGVNRYYAEQARWRALALSENCDYIPAVSPGYNDRGVRLATNHSALSRQLTAESLEGSLFHYQLKQAKQLVDTRVENMILVNSFNEWHEDTQIEPVLGIDTTTPELYTQGLEYVGYGDLYLRILGAATSKNESRHTEFDFLLNGI